MIGAQQNLNGSRDLTTLLSWMICHPCASTCYDQPTYHISTFEHCIIATNYEDEVVWGS